MLVRGDQQRIWAYHDGVDLGGPAFALEGDPRHYDTEAETRTFDVNVAPAA